MNEIDKAYQRFADGIETLTLSDASKRILNELKKLGRADVESLIAELRKGYFDDFHKNSYAFPRMELVDRLQVLGLHDMAKKVIHGGYDD